MQEAIDTTKAEIKRFTAIYKEKVSRSLIDLSIVTNRDVCDEWEVLLESLEDDLLHDINLQHEDILEG